MIQVVKRILPRRWQGPLRSLAAKLTTVIDLRTSTEFSHIGEPGPLITDLFARIRPIPGAFTVDDCIHFHLILSLQSAYGIVGDLFEIGSFHGRATAVMARHLGAGERIVACDAFELETEDRYAQKPSSEHLVRNILKVNPDLDRSRIVVFKCLSNDLELDSNSRFRFVHVDGGHSEEQVFADLELCAKHLVERGIMAIDDYHHRDWPGVTPGVDRFLREKPEFVVTADVNRHGAIGRKLYIMKKGPSTCYDRS